ncbi:Retrovirus-related Pol polyprotein from type-2 retrotransposable element R2DM [Araneus ventricosus]|uniref:Retrovirus-related Pol polyprotein from type-2 retrotransposable element R2DM n=1 Tax=Araneus ventricosus TaxID=182803 RepID=A0A4Y2Q659_ARAVE|nr:Retrovirus-related Pol polyprotein from type-2 retrotransposable element R2DM [Araneus ventricosus]
MCFSDLVSSRSDKVPVLHPSSSAPETPVILDPDPVSRPFDPGVAAKRSTPLAPTTAIPEPMMTTRRTTRSQTRHLEREIVEVIEPSPSAHLSPVAASTSSVSSSSNDSFDSNFALSFRESPELEKENHRLDFLQLLQTVQEIRGELDATSTSLFEPSSHDLSRVDPPADSDVAFSANMTDSKLIDHLDLLFYVYRSSMLSTELKEAWNDFKRRPCRDTLFIRTCMIIEVLLPDKSRPNPRRRVKKDNPQRGNLSRRKQRRIEYAQAQRNFIRNPTRYSDSLLNPTGTVEEQDPFNDDFRTFWETEKYQTDFAPAAIDPGDFRPISLTPIIARLFSKILARRLTPNTAIDPEQRGFIESDGIAQNIFLLDYVLKHAVERTKRTYIASLDIRKAFDSVSHDAVFKAMEAQSLDPEFIKLVKFIYKNSSTSFAPFSGHSFKPSCGAKQGDPLTSTLINPVIDQLIRKLKGRVGLKIDDCTMSISAYADDILLFASSPTGL